MNTHSFSKMASTSFVTTFINGLNDLRRDVIKEVITELESNEMVTPDIEELLWKMVANVKPNNKVSKPKQKRCSGYHIFMREHRLVVAAEQPDLTPQEMTSFVAKSWKDVSDEEKADYNARASKVKDGPTEAEGSGKDEPVLIFDKTKNVENVEKNEKKTKKNVETKKNKTDATSDTSNKEDIETADSDIDI
jgi:hypothetical protein